MANNDYRKMFLCLEPFLPEPKDLAELAILMSGAIKFPDADKITDILGRKKLSQIPRIPAGFTYLAQFITHDISWDSHSDRFLEENRPWNNIDTSKVKNKRSPYFDLDVIYGNEKPNNGEIPRSELIQEGDLPFLKLGDTLKSEGFPSYPNDLPRQKNVADAAIVDERNDENLLVAQTQVAFMKFHNAIVLELNESGEYKNKKDLLFDKARKISIRYYQHIIFEDFLPRFIEKSFRDEIVVKAKSGDLFYKAHSKDMFMPLEFSTAVFRMGHSMIRNDYELNKLQKTSLNKIMLFTGRGKMDSGNLFKRLKLPSSWIINWYLFYSIDNSDSLKNFNNAEQINTKISTALLRLRPKDLKNPDPGGMAGSIAAFDLFRGRAFELPSGQDIAEKIYGQGAGLSAAQIADVITIKQVSSLKPTREEIEQFEAMKLRMRGAFSKKTPLWFYILAEAELQNNGKLGKAGSRIFAESIIKILCLSEFSILREDWETGEDFLLKKYGKFGMAEMLKFVRDTNKKHFEVLYPGRTDYFDELNPLEKAE